MSKFIDRLEKVGYRKPTPIGFGAAARRDEADPQIMLLGHVSLDEVTKGRVLKAEVDAFLVDLSSWDEGAIGGLAESLKDRLWGVGIDGIDADQAGLLKEAGCDFVVFQAEHTAAAVLNDEDLGKLISVDADLDEDVAHAIHELSIDGALFSPGGDLLPLTVQKLIEVQQVRGLVDKPFVMSAPSGLSPGDLEALRNVGITGLMVEVSSLKAVAGTRKAITGLPRRRPRPASRDLIASSADWIRGA